APAAKNSAARSVAKKTKKRGLMERVPSVAQAHVLVLLLRAVIDLVLPLLLVAIERGTVERRRIGLALVLALLVVDHLRALATAGDAHRDARRGKGKYYGAQAVHDLVPPVAGAAPGAGVGAAPPGCCVAPAPPGTLYAVAQPHTSPPLPRCVTRSR